MREYVGRAAGYFAGAMVVLFAVDVYSSPVIAHDIPAMSAYAIGGIPVLHGGDTGYEPTIGLDDSGSIFMRMAAGEYFAVYAGGDWQFYIETASPLAKFIGDVHSRGFIGPNAPLVSVDSDFDPTYSTIRVKNDIVIVLPMAKYNPGRRLTVKAMSAGRATVFALAPEFVNEQVNHIVNPGDCATFEGYSDQLESGWIVVSQCRR